MSRVCRYICATLAVLLMNCCAISGLTDAEKQKCVKELLEWCRQNNYSGYTGIAASTSTGNVGGQWVTIACFSNSDGTKCKKGDSPWFHCTPEKTMTYNGAPLTQSTSVDDSVCQAKDRALGIRINSEYDREAYEQGMKNYQKGMANFHQQMSQLQQRMRNLPYTMFGNRFPFG